MKIINKRAIERRNKWANEIVTISGDFSSDIARIEQKLSKEIQQEGISALMDHLRLCTVIPEYYRHDSSEEKLYSKYTDVLISTGYSIIGLQSRVLSTRANSADVEIVADDYSFVADAKVFRLSRTAKNQKDFKIQAMDVWKHGKLYAMVVCPLYQVPSHTSQIYEQASTRNVCIFSYSHLAVLVQLAVNEGSDAIIRLLHEIFKTVQALNPSKNAGHYWQAVNRTMLDYGKCVDDIWRTEKIAAVESIHIAKNQALAHYAKEREKIMRMSRKEAITKLIEMYKIESRVEKIKSISSSKLLEIV